MSVDTALHLLKVSLLHAQTRIIMDLKKSIGFDLTGPRPILKDPFFLEYVNLKLIALGQPCFGTEKDYPFMELAHPLLANFRELSRHLLNYQCPVDQRIQSFLNDYLKDTVDTVPYLPSHTLVLDRHGLARVLSLPPDADRFESDIVSTYRIGQGILHNPRSDRRTTQGVFHVTEGGLPVPADKITVPKITFATMLRVALQPPQSLMRLPFTASQKEQAHVWTSLMLRPVVCPAIPGRAPHKSMEVRFFAPGNLVGNLDFVESIFGNAGHPGLTENDAGLDYAHWTGHTGCVILAPQLQGMPKAALGLPHVSKATPQQREQGMCYEKEDEPYNGGNAFKVTARDTRGVIVTLIADNYFGYCKKEVKTQISFAANLYGQAEEEHAGGAIAFPSYDLGEDFRLNTFVPEVNHSFEEVLSDYGDLFELHAEGYAINRDYPDILLVHQDAYFNLQDQSIAWSSGGKDYTLRLKPGITYMLPSGYKVQMIQPHETRRWRLVGTTAEGAFCHKPCTVSGGGKSEISKSISDAVIHGPVIVAQFQQDLDQVEAIINKEYGQRFRNPERNKPKGRPLLSPQRSLGSVVKLLTPSSEYTDEFNDWLHSTPYYIKELVFVVKRFYKPDWGDSWRERFNVDMINGASGNELKYRAQKLITQYLRVGYTSEGAWRTFGLRKDFFPAAKIQTEDDISAAVVVPRESVKGLNPDNPHRSVKFIRNCEYRLFQRPDEAIVRGYDKQTEADMARPANFLSNYEPLTREQVKALADDTIRFGQYTEPMRKLLADFIAAAEPAYCVSSAHPRIVDGKPTKNPRYLQDSQAITQPRAYYLADLGTRLFRRIPGNDPVPLPVNAVLAGRRNNPPEAGIRSLAVYNPIHYFELPELFMEFISSMTGKSPSTTGAGSEGALTKGPFNALLPVHDLNNALVSYLLTGYGGFVSSAGCIGPRYRVDHDISLLIPEVWSRMKPEEREPDYMIAEGYLERCNDFEHDGKPVLASRLGYRITERFVRHFFGRIFANPGSVFPEDMLKPELQDLAIFADGMDNIVSTHQRVAQFYFDDASVNLACPPLKALLHIMKDGEYEGLTLDSPDFRKQFTRDALLASDWYKARLDTRLAVERRLVQGQIERLETFAAQPNTDDLSEKLQLKQRLKEARAQQAALDDSAYRDSLVGTLGTDPALYVGTK